MRTLQNKKEVNIVNTEAGKIMLMRNKYGNDTFSFNVLDRMAKQYGGYSGRMGVCTIGLQKQQCCPYRRKRDNNEINLCVSETITK